LSSNRRGNGGGTPPSAPTAPATASGAGGGGPTSAPPDKCDHNFRVALVSTKPAALPALKQGDHLEVGLHHDPPYLVVVCRIPPAGQVVGSIANVPRLDELIRCIQQGVAYTALITNLSGTNVTVHVHRASP
jgi:hypothetical protein